MKLGHPVNTLIYLLLKLGCRVDASAFASIPDEGPLIIATNHVNFLEMPILYLYFKPRVLTGIAKIEIWRNPLLRYLAHIWKPILIRRDSADVGAYQHMLQALDHGRIIAIAPEGTRSHDGKLGRASAGVVMLAAESGVPVLPVAHFGGNLVWHNLTRLRRTRFEFRVGKPMYFSRTHIATRQDRAQAIDKLMRALASLLPEEYRGYYA